MAFSLTSTQRDCLRIIAELIELGHGVGQTHDEIQREMDLSARGEVSRLLISLEERECIRRVRGLARAIELVAEPPPLPPEPEFVGLFDDPELVEQLARSA